MKIEHLNFLCQNFPFLNCYLMSRVESSNPLLTMEPVPRKTCWCVFIHYLVHYWGSSVLYLFCSTQFNVLKYHEWQLFIELKSLEKEHIIYKGQISNWLMMREQINQVSLYMDNLMFTCNWKHKIFFFAVLSHYLNYF